MANAYMEDEYESWITNFCGLFGHDFFVEVSREFIEDDFNLTGLSNMVAHYRDALDLILDFVPETQPDPKDEPFIARDADELYGLIHARYILTKEGLNKMAKKYEQGAFGVCTRVECDSMFMLPIGRYDQPGVETVRLYCPCCNDIYFPSSLKYLNIDGAYFGTTFAGFFINTFKEVEEQALLRHKTFPLLQLKIFGFNISELSKCGPRMKWLRQYPRTKEELEEFNKCEYVIPTLKDGKVVDPHDEINGKGGQITTSSSSEEEEEEEEEEAEE